MPDMALMLKLMPVWSVTVQTTNPDCYIKVRVKAWTEEDAVEAAAKSVGASQCDRPLPDAFVEWLEWRGPR